MGMRPSPVRYMSRARTIGTGPMCSVAYQTNPGGRTQCRCSALTGTHGVPLARCILPFCLRWTPRTNGLPTTPVYCIPLDGLWKAIEDPLADEPRFARKRRCCQQALNVAFHQSTESGTSPQFRRHSCSERLADYDPKPLQSCSHRVPLVGHHDPDDLWSDQDPAPALDGSQASKTR
jgi:hypothetical protein